MAGSIKIFLIFLSVYDKFWAFSLVADDVEVRMDFAFTEDQEFFRSSVRKVVDRLIRPRIEQIDEEDDFPRDLWDEFAKLGYLGLRHEEKYGGMDADTLTSMIFY